MITKYSYGVNTCKSQKNNVIERFKNDCAEEIRADLDTRRGDLVTICENLDYNINIGSVIRSNNAFLGKAVYITGRRRFDRRGTVGTTHLEHVYHADTTQEVIEMLREKGYYIFAVDNIAKYNPVNLAKYEFIPRKSAFVFGNEGDGLKEETIKLCDKVCYIQQFGSVRSLNVSQAAAIIQYEYTIRYFSEPEKISLDLPIGSMI